MNDRPITGAELLDSLAAQFPGGMSGLEGLIEEAVEEDRLLPVPPPPDILAAPRSEWPALFERILAVDPRGQAVVDAVQRGAITPSPVSEAAFRRFLVTGEMPLEIVVQPTDPEAGA